MPLYPLRSGAIWSGAFCTHTQRHPSHRRLYVEARLAERPESWRGAFACRSFAQGFSGYTDGLAPRKEITVSP